MAPFTKGEEVFLSYQNLIVASGVVQKVEPNDTCQGQTIGKGGIVVLIEHAIDKECELPIPSPKAKTLEDAVDLCIIWNIADVSRKIESVGLPDKLETSEKQNLASPRPPSTQEANTNASIPATLVELEDSLDGCSSQSDEEIESENDEATMNKSPRTQIGLDPTRFRPTSVEGVDGDEVHLLLHGVVAAKGIVFRTNPEETVHNVLIGSGNISVKVVEVKEDFEGEMLPYPHAGADTIGESVGSIVKWALADVRKIGEDGEMASDEDDNPNGNPSMESTKEKDYTIRSTWYMERVEIFCPERQTVLAKGIITVFASFNAVNDELLGENNVGVTLLNIDHPQYFQNVVDGIPPLFSWPIHCVKLIDNGRFLGDIIAEDTMEFNHEEPQVLKLPTPTKKRHYNTTKRKRVDPDILKQKRLATKAAKSITEEVIDEVCRKLCCNLKCCLTMPREHVEEARKEFQGMSTGDKATYIFSLFENREKDVIDSGLMILKTKVVCKKAFHIIHGFSHTQFYNYEKQYKEGAKVGGHGNKGSRKTRTNTLTALAFLEKILKDSGEPMPHISYNGKCGTDTIEYRLPCAFTKISIWEEVNDNMAAQGLPPIGFSTFYRMWAEKFANFKIHKSSAFAKCDVCSTLQMQLRGERRKEQRNALEKERARHLQQQMSRRQVYYAARISAKAEPQNYLCIIHDKMDQSKTWLPKLVPIPKALSSGGHNVPIALTGMLTHGREPGAYAHFSLTGLWPGDADFTVSSIAKCLRDLEEFDGDKSGDITIDLTETTTRPIFKAVMDSKAFKASYLEPNKLDMHHYQGREDVEVGSTSNVAPTNPNHEEAASQTEGQSNEGSSSTPFKSLPPILHLQMDNSGKDNKNQYLIAYASDLVCRGHFVKIVMSFLMKGHTHEDIDAMFSRVSVRIRGKGISTLQALMAEVWECEAIHPVPRLIQEVGAYKDYLKTGKTRSISGQSQPVAFQFSMMNNTPVYQYKASITSPWIPPNGRCLWDRDPITDELLIPSGEVFAKEMEQYHKDAHEVVPFIEKYIEYISRSCTDETSVAYREVYPVVKHWETIANTLRGDLRGEVGENTIGERVKPLSDGFWPKTNHGTGYKSNIAATEQANTQEDNENPELATLRAEVDEEMHDREEIYVGPPSEIERQRWVPLLDIEEGKFIMLNPNDEWEGLHGKGKFWLVKALSSVDENHALDNNRQAMFKVEWWRPKHGSPTVGDAIRYSRIFAVNQGWERDPGYATTLDIWQLASSAVYGFKTRMKPENISKSGLKIPAKSLDIVKKYIDRLNDPAEA